MLRFQTALVPIAFLVLASPTLQAQDYERIDVNNLGQPANAPTSGGADISHDGRFVAFVSSATNFGGPDPIGTWDVFLRDRLLGTTTRVTSTAVASGSPDIVSPSIAGDGSKIAFMRRGSTPTTNYRSYLYVVSTGTLTEILVPGHSDIRVQALSFDGTYAVIAAPAAALTPTIYRLTLATGALVLCSRDVNGNPVGAGGGDIDDDGTHVAFSSNSSNIVPGDTNTADDVFVYDIPGDVMLRASVPQGGGNPNSYSRAPSISGNGRYVAFDSGASNLVPADNNATFDVFLRDLRLEVTTIVSLKTSQTQLATGGRVPFLSADASSVAFVSLEQLPSGDGALSHDTFLRDSETGALLPSSPGSLEGLSDTYASGISGDGREVLLSSQQPALGGPWGSVYVAKFGPRCSSSGYCTSLPNSTGQAASIGAQGDASLQLNNLVISAVGLPDTANAMLVSGTSAVDPGTPFGNGLMCIGGALIRHGVQVATGGVILDAQDVHSAEYIGVNPGDTRYYQVVYRDPPAGGALFNTTDAVAITFCW